MKEKNQQILLDEIRKDLDCTDSDDVFCKENALSVLIFIGEHVGFSQDEADTICEVMDGACQRSWTKASCVDDTNDILYPRLTDPENQKRIAKKMTDLYKDEELHDTLELLGEDESQWEQDMVEFIGVFVQIHDNLGAGILCGLVGQALN